VVIRGQERVVERVQISPDRKRARRTDSEASATASHVPCGAKREWYLGEAST